MEERKERLAVEGTEVGRGVAEQLSEGAPKGAQKGRSVSDGLAAFDAFKKRIILEWWKAAIQRDRKGEQM